MVNVGEVVIVKFSQDKTYPPASPTPASVPSGKLAPEEVAQLQAHLFSHNAAEYIYAALVSHAAAPLDPTFSKDPALPTYHMAAHAIELTFKGLLIRKGITEKELKSRGYSHQLGVLLQKARELYPDYARLKSERVTQVVQSLEKADFNQRLRYREALIYDFPAWADVRATMFDLFDAVQVGNGQAVAEARFQDFMGSRDGDATALSWGVAYGIGVA
jgi:hypothetical protein